MGPLSQTMHARQHLYISSQVIESQNQTAAMLCVPVMVSRCSNGVLCFLRYLLFFASCGLQRVAHPARLARLVGGSGLARLPRPQFPERPQAAFADDPCGRFEDGVEDALDPAASPRTGLNV